VGELVYDGVIFYNVIEALNGGVQRSYYNPISEFSDSDIYMGSRQPESAALTSKQREDVLDFLDNDEVVGKPYAWGQSAGILFGMLRGNLVKGALGTYNCVGLAEAAYEYAGVNGGQGLVSDWAEGNFCTLPICILTPAEQYNKTVPAEGYTVSGRVTNSQANEIPDVTLNFDLTTFNDNYSDSFFVTTNSNGEWVSSKKLGQEWIVTPQKDGYTFEPSNLKVKGNANDINFIGSSEQEILTSEEIELIREWGYGGDYVIRWPNGYVDVYDETNYSRMQEVINEWNIAISGPVILRLSSNSNSPVKVVFDWNIIQEGYCWTVNNSWSGYTFSEVMIKISSDESSCDYPNTSYSAYLCAFNAVAGFNYWAEANTTPFDTWSNFNKIPDMIKKMVHALYKVPSGYYLGESKSKINQSSTVIEDNIQLGTKGGCACNCRK